MSNGRRFVSDNGQVLLLAFDTATPAVTVALRGDEGVLAEHTEIDARRHGELLAPGIEKVLADAGRTRTELTGVAVGVGPGPFTGLRVGLMTARALSDALDIPVHGVCTLDILAAEVMAGMRGTNGDPAAGLGVPGSSVPGADAQRAGDAGVGGGLSALGSGVADADARRAREAGSGGDSVAGLGALGSVGSLSTSVGSLSTDAWPARDAGAGDSRSGGASGLVAVGGGFAVATDARRREVYWATYDLTGRRTSEPSVDRPAEIAGRIEGLAVAGQGPVLYPEQFPHGLQPALPSAAVLAELTARLLREAPDTLLPPHPLYLRRPDAVEPGARKSVTPA